LRHAVLALTVVLAACKSGEPRAAAEYRTLLSRGRTMPLTREHATKYVATWTAILDMTGDEAVRTEARYNLGCAALRGKNTAVAERRFAKAAASRKKSVSRTMSHYQLASLRVEQQNWREALVHARAYLDGMPHNADWIASAHYFVCLSLVRLDRPLEARRAYREAPDSNRTRESALAWQGLAYEIDQHWK